MLCVYLSDVDPPKEGRVRRTPVRLDDCNGTGVMLSIKEKSHQLYMEVFDLAINGIKARFEQKGIELLLQIELLLCSGANPATSTSTICDAYGFDSFDLEAELRVYKKDDDIVKDDITTVIASYKNNLIINKSLYPIIFKILKLIVVLPATNASSERSFFALSRLKTAGRTSMMQDRLNHLLLLHVHKNKTDTLDIQSVIRDFVQCHPSRESSIAVYK